MVDILIEHFKCKNVYYIISTLNLFWISLIIGYEKKILKTILYVPIVFIFFAGLPTVSIPAISFSISVLILFLKIITKFYDQNNYLCIFCPLFFEGKINSIFKGDILKHIY